MPPGAWTGVSPKNHVLSGSPDPPAEGGNFGRISPGSLKSIGNIWHEPCKNRRADRDAVCHVESGRPKELHVRRTAGSPVGKGHLGGIFWHAKPR